MYFTKFSVAAASAALFAIARADIDLDNDDIPRQCLDLCQHVDRLADICNDIDDDFVDDRTEDLLEAQCYCANDSFDVRRVTAQCAACMHEHNRDRDDNEDIDDIMFTCGFPSTTYDSNAQATGISVSATRPARSEDLTTTITPTNAGVQTGSDSSSGPAASATDDSGNSNNNGGGNGNSDDNSSDDSNNNNGNSDSSNSNDSSNNDDDDSAASGQHAWMTGVYVAAAAVAGAMMLQ